MKKDTMNSAQRDVWASLLSLYQDDPDVELNMPAWANFLQDVTGLVDQGDRCVWRGQTVSLDNAAPYVMEPHPDFPFVEQYGDTKFNLAWAPERRPPPEHLAQLGEAGTEYRTPSDFASTEAMPPALEPADDLDEVCRRTTAFRSFGEMVDTMRGSDGYGQGYIPTLIRDEEATPQHQKDIQALRDAVQEHGFAVYPTDEDYERYSMLDEPEDRPALDELEYEAEDCAPEAGD
ncbi:MAG: hypothetical protein AAF449_00975 [Myxococcota bacterium]